MKIRKIQNKDINKIYQLGIDEKEFEVSEDMLFWSKKQLKKWISSNDDVLLVAEDNKKIVGFIMSAIHKPTQKVTIENIYVVEEYRKKGLAKKLLNETLKIFRKKGIKFINAFVDDKNTASFNFFKKNNFKVFSKFYWVYKD